MELTTLTKATNARDKVLAILLMQAEQVRSREEARFILAQYKALTES